MAIKNALKGELSNIQNSVKNRDQLQNMVNDTLFGLLNAQTDRRIIADAQFFNQLSDLASNGLDIEAEVTSINANISNRVQTSATPPQNALTSVTYTTNSLSEIATTIQRVAAELQRVKLTKINLERRIAQKSSELSEANKNQRTTQGERDAIRTDLNNLNGQLETLDADIAEGERVMPLLENLLKIQRISVAMTSTLGTTATPGARRTELNSIINLMGNGFRINQPTYVAQLPTQAIGYGQAIAVTTGTTTNNYVDLPAQFIGALPVGVITSYALCDNDTGEELNDDNGRLQVKLNGGQTISLRGLEIDTNNHLVGTNIQIEPIENTKFPITIELSVRGRIQEPNTGIHLDNYKPLTITLNAPTLSPTDRQAAYTNVNTALGAQTINNRITSVYNGNNVDRENEVIWDILKAGGNKEEVEKIYANEELRDRLLERIRNLPGLVPVLPLPTLQTNFATYITDPARKVNPEHLTSINAFTDFLRNDMEKNIQTYLKDTVKTSIEGRTAANGNNRDKVVATFMQFVTDVANNKLENDDHMQLLGAIPANEPTRRADSFFQRLLGRGSAKNNYTKFFTGREATVDKQMVEIAKKNVTYSLNLKVHGVNKMTATIKLDGVDEPIIIDAPNHNTLVQAILAREATKDGEPLSRKARCHMAMAAMKALVQMSPTTLHREYNGQVVATDTNTYNVDRVDAFVRGDNLVLRANCAASHGNRTRENHIIFDENRYKNMHNVDELQNGVVSLSHQLNSIMDAMGGEFDRMTNGVIPRLTTREMNYGTNFPLRFGWAKRLYGRLAHNERNYNFNFTTSASAGGKTTQIGFVDGMFTLAGTHNGEAFQIQGRNLGELLRHKVKRQRVFDGVELAIVEKVNESMIEKLRTNGFVQSENFAVSDFDADKSGKVYILDASGNLSYLEIEDRAHNPLGNRNAGVIPENTLPPQRIRCNEKERKDFMQNPLLAGRLVRQMRLQLALF